MNNKQIKLLIALSGLVLVLAAVIISPHEARWFGIDIPMMYMFNFAEIFIFMYGMAIGTSVGRELKRGEAIGITG